MAVRALLGLISFVGVAQAQTGAATPSEAVQPITPKAVLELFTSQGCSSCPAADALFRNYAARRDLVALSFPVDYWDYLGWKDTLANPKFSARQRSYAKHRGDGRIYTPQMVINGSTHAVGSSAQEIDHAIESNREALSRRLVPLAIHMEKTQVVIEAGDSPAGAPPAEAHIWLAMVQPEVEVAVRGGENHGRTLKYYNVVRDLSPIGMWNGKAMTIRLDRDTLAAPGANACAVLMQSGKAGPIVAAAMLGKM